MMYISTQESILTHSCRSISMNRYRMVFWLWFDMIRRGEMFGIKITMIIFTRSPVDKELFLVDTISDPKNLISILWDLFFLTLLLTIPQAAELPVLMDVRGWGWPSSRSAVQIGTAFYPLRNKAPNSDSVADATIFLIILLSM